MLIYVYICMSKKDQEMLFRRMIRYRESINLNKGLNAIIFMTMRIMMMNLIIIPIDSNNDYDFNNNYDMN